MRRGRSLSFFGVVWKSRSTFEISVMSSLRTFGFRREARSSRCAVLVMSVGLTGAIPSMRSFFLYSSGAEENETVGFLSTFALNAPPGQ